MHKKAQCTRLMPLNAAARMNLTVGAAVCAVLYGLPLPARAQQTGEPSRLEEITVTASRRTQTPEEVPYSLSVIGGEKLTELGIVDTQSLALQVPGLSMFDFGARDAGAVAPIIRGLNATGEPRGFRTFEQDPVGTYVGNSPMSGYFQLDDLKQVEVLRGPQGTLYGAGALGGALRFIPNDPQLNKFSAQLGAGATNTAHSSGTGYALNGLMNLPLGDTFALRASAKYEYEPGFIHVNGLIQRDQPYLTGVPVLADPTDPVNSPAVFTQKDDWNGQKTLTGRAALLWKPTSAFSAEIAYLYSHLKGDGGPQANPDVPAGPYALDPRVNFPAGGPYRDFSPSEQPYKRSTGLLSLDVSLDVGFATLSSTSSYYHTGGATSGDDTYHFASRPAYLNYYAGSPINPRYLEIQEFDDDARTFSQEVRLVSNAAPGRPIDYTVGVYYEHSIRNGSWDVVEPGTYERAIAQGCTNYYYLGAQFPNCLLNFGPNRTSFFQADRQDFTDKSVFGEVTWHVAPQAQITFGGRHFKQDFTDAQSYLDYPFQILLPAVPHSAPASKNTWKVNPSYEYADKQYVYATWSQGFRRGGANSVPLVGIYKESALLQQYKPDSVNNYELGLKGRMSNGLTYTVAVFDVEWENPQISASLPSGNLAVYNGDHARSRGFEVETSGPLFIDGLSYNLGIAVAHAELTRDFSLPANDGTGQIVQDEVKGFAGEQLPGSPRFSSSASVSYVRELAPDYLLTLSVNHTYRSHAPMGLANSDGSNTLGNSSAFGLWNLATSIAHGPWTMRLLANNLLDKRAVLAPPTRVGFLNNLTNDYQINRPRVLGVTIVYDFR
jgi:outer membrane receptor protein involved in Fe transport